MKDNSILKRLGALGFPLFETEDAEDANLTLADVVKSKDLLGRTARAIAQC